MAIEKPTTQEIPFSERLLPQLEKAFEGFHRNHLDSLIGKYDVSKLTHRNKATNMVDYLLYRDFNEQEGRRQDVVSIRSSFCNEPSNNWSFFDVHSFYLGEDDVLRFMRLDWSNKRNINDLCLEGFKLFPLPNEKYHSGLYDKYKKKKKKKSSITKLAACRGTKLCTAFF